MHMYEREGSDLLYAYMSTICTCNICICIRVGEREIRPTPKGRVLKGQNLHQGQTLRWLLALCRIAIVVLEHVDV
jgi:hypothetical protein